MSAGIRYLLDDIVICSMIYALCNIIIAAQSTLYICSAHFRNNIMSNLEIVLRNFPVKICL